MLTTPHRHHSTSHRCLQLREIFVVRWSVFLLGPAGCGKTAIWKTLRHAQNELGEKTVFKPINPKAVRLQPLCGFQHVFCVIRSECLLSCTMFRVYFTTCGVPVLEVCTCFMSCCRNNVLTIVPASRACFLPWPLAGTAVCSLLLECSETCKHFHCGTLNSCAGCLAPLVLRCWPVSAYFVPVCDADFSGGS